MMYVPGDKVVVRAWGKNEIGLITNVRKKKNQILGYDLRTERGSAYCVVTVDKPEMDKSLGHSTANFDRTTCRPDDRQYEKCMDFSFPVQGARSF